MYIGLLHTHSLLRWVLLFLLVVTVVKALVGWLNGQKYSKLDNKLAVYSLILAHTQLLLGIGLFFLSPIVKGALQNMGAAMKDPALRYWSVEHTSMMILGIALITIGRVRSKKSSGDKNRHRLVGVFYGIGLLCILSRIPWDRLGIFG